MHNQQTISKSFLILDRVGILASLLCGIHCLVMPLAFPILASIGISWLGSWQSEWYLLVLMVGIAAFSLLRSYLWHHGQIKALFWAFTGLSIFIWSASQVESMQVFLRLIGGTALAIAHFVNFELLRKGNQTTQHTFSERRIHVIAMIALVIGGMFWSYQQAASHQPPASREELLMKVWNVHG